MITETLVLERLKMEIGDDVFDVLDPSYFLNILKRKTLMTWSIRYPHIIRGVTIRASDAIESYHPQTGRKAVYKYKIPKENINHEYINIEMDYYPGNYNSQGYTGSHSVLTESMIGKIASYMPTASRRYSIRFIAPDIAYIDPIPRVHMDFAVDMQRLKLLHEIPLYYMEIFIELFVADVKIALYNKFKNLRDGQTYQGLEVNTYIGDFSDAKSDRKEIMETMNKDYYKDPERFRSLVHFSD